MKNLSQLKTPLVVIAVIVLFAGGLMLLGGGKEDRINGASGKVTVFYSPTCSCCSNHISYMERKGYEVEEMEQVDLSEIKDKYGIPYELESCHTSVIGEYVVEGHMPVEVIQKLMAEKPDIAGIALAGMPSGSPGMGGAKHDPFQIHSITADGEDGGIFMEF